MKVRYHGKGKPPPKTPGAHGPTTMSSVVWKADPRVVAIPIENNKNSFLVWTWAE